MVAAGTRGGLLAGSQQKAGSRSLKRPRLVHGGGFRRIHASGGEAGVGPASESLRAGQQRTHCSLSAAVLSVGGGRLGKEVGLLPE